MESKQIPTYPARREEEKKVYPSKYVVPESHQPEREKVPVPRTNVNYGRENEVPAELYEEQQYMSDFGMTPEEQEMQEIIMQSMKQQAGGRGKKEVKKSTAPSSHLTDVPFIEGEDLNESFIAKQVAIEEELSRKKHR